MRPDIQWLRGFAVAAVVAYHLNLPYSQGGFLGVDVFFVISGFLVGGGIVRELQRNGSVKLAAFWARRIRRILPAATAVIVATIAASVVLLSPLRLTLWGQGLGTSSVVKDALAALFYIPNLWFAQQGNSYLAAQDPSPFTQYWSLGIEEQFYVLAPLLLAVLWLAAKRRHGVFTAALCGLIGASLVYGIVLEHSSEVNAFYLPGARAWELGIGILAAMLPRLWRSPAASRIRALLCLCCGLALTALVVMLSPAHAWPGTFTVVVVTITALYLWLGADGVSQKLDHLLKPAEYLGDRSYSIYLWHWPLIVLAPVALGHELNRRDTVLAVVAIAVLAEASFRLVESPYRKAPTRTRRERTRIIVAGALTMVTVAGLILLAPTAAKWLAPEQPTVVADALIPIDDVEFANVLPANLRPQLEHAKDDVPLIYDQGCHTRQSERTDPITPCIFGSGTRSVVLFGDSHAAQWFPGLFPAANRGEFRLISITASNCTPMSPVRYPGDGYDDCEAWRQGALDYLAENPPSMIVISAYLSRAVAAADPDGVQFAHSLDKLFNELPPGVPVRFIADTPEFETTPVDCIAESPTSLHQCGLDPAAARSSTLGQAAHDVVIKHDGLYIDLNPRICSPQWCGVVRADTLVYRDHHHLTATYATELGPLLLAQLNLTP